MSAFLCLPQSHSPSPGPLSGRVHQQEWVQIQLSNTTVRTPFLSFLIPSFPQYQSSTAELPINTARYFQPSNPNTKNNKKLQKMEACRRPKPTCIVMLSIYDCGHKTRMMDRLPGCWKCEKANPGFCKPPDEEMHGGAICPNCHHHNLCYLRRLHQ